MYDKAHWSNKYVQTPMCTHIWTRWLICFVATVSVISINGKWNRNGNNLFPFREIGMRSTDKKVVLLQRWPRDARYISRSWAVAEIWPFEINQDGGGRHIEFVQIENSAIRSAVPENPAQEQNMKWIGRPVVEISPLEIFPTWLWPPSWICSNRK